MTYTTVLADPPWAYSDELLLSATKRGAASNYPTMSIQQICDLYEPSRYEQRGRIMTGKRGFLAGHEIADVAFLFLWCTGPILLEAIPQRVANAWGFTPKQIVPWIKGRVAVTGYTGRQPPIDRCADLILQTGMGRITRGVTEFLLVCARGKYSALVKDKGQNGLILAEEDSVLLAARGAHSAKPKEQYALIEKVCPGPYLELFARQTRVGWTSWGNELLPQAGEVSIETDFNGGQVIVEDFLPRVPSVQADMDDPYLYIR